MTPTLETPHTLAMAIAQAAQIKRLSLNLTQRSLAERSGVSLSSLKKFERTGQISLSSLLHLAAALGCLEDFLSLFQPKPAEQFSTLDALLKEKNRQRGRK